MVPESPSSKIEYGISSFEETEVEDDDLSESELEHEEPKDVSKCCFLFFGCILMMPLILGVAYYLMYVYVPESRSLSYLMGVPTEILQSGPLVGHTTHNSSKIWFYHGHMKDMDIIYWRNAENMDSSTEDLFNDLMVAEYFSRPQSVELIPDPDANGAATSTIQGLEANTKYHFEIRLGNESIATGQFKTAPLRSAATIVSINTIISSNDTTISPSNTTSPSNNITTSSPTSNTTYSQSNYTSSPSNTTESSSHTNSSANDISLLVNTRSFAGDVISWNNVPSLPNITSSSNTTAIGLNVTVSSNETALPSNITLFPSNSTEPNVTRSRNETALPSNITIFQSNSTEPNITRSSNETSSLPSNITLFPNNDTDRTSSASKGTSFKYLLASCMNVKSDMQGYKSQPVWHEVLSKGIDFALIPGDTVYMNLEDLDSQGNVEYHRLWFRNLQQRAESHFADFISRIPIYTTWDDWDYGTNNADHSQLGKENSLAAWGHLWPNPYQGSSKGVGNYYSYSWGDVDYFVMDCRWYRNIGKGILFGDSQMEWLSEKLIQSTATFKIIVSGSDLMEKGLAGDIKEIGKVVANHSISGVLFHSGDIHRNEFKMQNMQYWPYPVVQITSSGIAKVVERPFAIITIDTSLEDPEVFTQFYIADTNNRETTWSNNVTADCHEIRKVRDRRMKQQCSKVIRLSDLTPPPLQ